MIRGDIESGLPAIDAGEASPPAGSMSDDRKLVLVTPLSRFACLLIGVGLLLPFTVSIPGLEPFRKEIIGASCIMIFLGTVGRMRLQRCRSELMQAEVTPRKPDIRRRLWAAVPFDSLHGAKHNEHDFHCMQIQMGEATGAPIKTVLDKASVLDPAYAKSAQDSQNTCLCCLEEFEASSVVALLPCGHIFHEDCIMEWTVAKRRASRACPVCRANFMVV